MTIGQTSNVNENPSTALPPILHMDVNASSSTKKAKAVDRNWLRKLLSKHSSDSRLENHRKLCAKYPILQNKALVVAPMVDQSDLPFRLLCRRYGANLCFTPMIHAKMFVGKPGYRKKFWSYVKGMPPADRPLIAQLCGSDKDALLQTVNYLLEAGGGTIDGIDLNCGCPQSIAKRGVYGAFLLEKEDLLLDVVKFLCENVDCPVSVKVRLLPSGVEDSLKLYGKLIDAGASMLTIHGRTRLQKGLDTGHADWDAIRRAVEMYGDKVPILANGSISNLDDARVCLEHTGADGIMSSEAILEYPPVFTETGTLEVGYKRIGPGRLALAREYMELCQEFPPEKGGQGTGIRCVRAHLHRFLHIDLKVNPKIRQAVAFAQEYDELFKACDDIEAFYEATNHFVEDESLSWYMRHRIVDENAVNSVAVEEKKREVACAESDDEAAGCFVNLFGDEDGESCG